MGKVRKRKSCVPRHIFRGSHSGLPPAPFNHRLGAHKRISSSAPPSAGVKVRQVSSVPRPCRFDGGLGERHGFCFRTYPTRGDRKRPLKPLEAAVRIAAIRARRNIDQQCRTSPTQSPAQGCSIRPRSPVANRHRLSQRHLCAAVSIPPTRPTAQYESPTTPRPDQTLLDRPLADPNTIISVFPALDFPILRSSASQESM